MTFKNSLLVLLAMTVFLFIIEYFLCSFLSYFTFNTLFVGTFFISGVHFLSLMISYKASKNKSPHQFVSGITISTVIKLFLTIITAGIYLYFNKNNLNKLDLFFLMGVYLIFLFLESYIAAQFAKKNA